MRNLVFEQVNSSVGTKPVTCVVTENVGFLIFVAKDILLTSSVGSDPVGLLTLEFLSRLTMKYKLSLLLTLVPVWFLWSGKTMPFILILGAISVLLSLWVAHRMGVDDEEGTPLGMGIRALPTYLPWLAKEIVVSNISVAKMILSRDMKLNRNMIEVSADPKTTLGKVVLANSITLTPGTVSVKLEDDRILVHALSFEGAEEDLSGDISRRVCALEKTRPERKS